MIKMEEMEKLKSEVEQLVGTNYPALPFKATIVLEYSKVQNRSTELPLWPQIPSQEAQRGIESGETQEEGNR